MKNTIYTIPACHSAHLTFADAVNYGATSMKRNYPNATPIVTKTVDGAVVVSVSPYGTIHRLTIRAIGPSNAVMPSDTLLTEDVLNTLDEEEEAAAATEPDPDVLDDEDDEDDEEEYDDEENEEE